MKTVVRYHVVPILGFWAIQRQTYVNGCPADVQFIGHSQYNDPSEALGDCPDGLPVFRVDSFGATRIRD